MLHGIHTSDDDCTLNATDTCIDCGVYHGDPCSECGRRGFHAQYCIEATEATLDGIRTAIAAAMDAGRDRAALRIEYGAISDRLDTMREPFRIAARTLRLRIR